MSIFKVIQAVYVGIATGDKAEDQVIQRARCKKIERKLHNIGSSKRMLLSLKKETNSDTYYTWITLRVLC